MSRTRRLLITNAIITAHVGAQGQSDLEIDFVNRVLRESESGGGGEFIEVSRQLVAQSTWSAECIYRPSIMRGRVNGSLRRFWERQKGKNEKPLQSGALETWETQGLRYLDQGATGIVG